jgi:hypothetical protein
MTFFTFQPGGGPELFLANWGISRPIRKVSNGTASHFADQLATVAAANAPMTFYGLMGMIHGMKPREARATF